MPIDFRRCDPITIDPTSHQIQNETGTVVFNSKVLRAEVALNGFDVRFTGGEHPIHRQIIDASIAKIQDRTVTVNIKYLLRDASGPIDDVFQGKFDALVIAEVQ
jgi:hypothetical protein